MAEENTTVKPLANGYITNYTALLWLCAVLVLIGLLAIYSASYLKAEELYNDPFFFLKKQALVAAVGFLAILVTLYIPLSWIERATLPITAFCLLLLSLVIVPGFYSKVGGANRWINLAGIRFQPSEFAKIALVLFLAKSLSRKSTNLNNFVNGMLPNLLVVGLFGVFLMLQPDFGTTAILLLLTFLLFYVAGLEYRYITGGVAALLMAFIGAIILAPYRLKRLVSFLDPWSQFKEGGFQIIQSYLAFQNGHLLGTGLGNSQQKLYFLPEAHTDFILSVIGEELGLLGLILVFSIYILMVYIGIKISVHQVLNYRRFLGFGLTALLGLQAFLNIGVTMGLLPTKGLPLPFLSNGSSALLAFFAVVALLAKLGREMPGINHDEHLS